MRRFESCYPSFKYFAVFPSNQQNMGQKINPRSLRSDLWDRAHWAYYTSPQISGMAWTQSLKRVLTWNSSLSLMKRYRALKAPSRRQRKKPALWSLTHWLRLLPYSQWYHSHVYKLGSRVAQKNLSPIKLRYRFKARNRNRHHGRGRARNRYFMRRKSSPLFLF